MTVYQRWGWQNPKALSLVFMAEAFRADELGVFAMAVEQTLAAFEATEPFSTILPALRAVRIDIPSQESGIGTRKRKTYFKGRFTVPRVIEVDQGIAARVLNDHVNSSAVAMVLANTTDYGGSGGAAMVFSRELNWSTEIAIHELGHARFHLADEYSAAGQAATLEPVERNVSKYPDRPRLKWAAQVDPATPLPTQSFGQPDPIQKPIGAYEGAKYQKQGIFRPAWMCKMREVGQPFCPVCSKVITDLLTPHLP